MRIEKPAPGLAIEQQAEGLVLRLQVIGEARGEQDAGGRLESVAMLGVLHVDQNRQLLPGRFHGKSLKEIALAPWQFSCFNENDPNREKLLDLWQTDPASWERADTVADLFESGLTLDPTGGATHYCTRALWDVPRLANGRARWHDSVEIASGRTRLTTVIGNHVFARAA